MASISAGVLPSRVCSARCAEGEAGIAQARISGNFHRAFAWHGQCPSHRYSESLAQNLSWFCQPICWKVTTALDRCIGGVTGGSVSCLEDSCHLVMCGDEIAGLIVGALAPCSVSGPQKESVNSANAARTDFLGRGSLLQLRRCLHSP